MTPDEFGLRLAKACGVAPGAHVLAAVSGGADSVALLCFLSELRESYPLKLSCAHVEHGIRGEASRQDAAFVRGLCARLDIAYYEGKTNVPEVARERGIGLEEAARAMRYLFLYDTQRKTGADVIALAHHAMDQAETVLMHALRGSDMRGLCAMRPRSGALIRPLLDLWPDELKAYLTSIGQAWREDGTNQIPDNARNIVRLLAMPQLERAYPGGAKALTRLAQAAQRDERHFMRELQKRGVRLTMLTDGAAVERETVQSLDGALLSRVIGRMMALAHITADFAAVGRVTDMIRGGQQAVSFTGGGARMGKRFLCITARSAICPDTMLGADGVTDTLFGRFTVHKAKPGETGDGRMSQAIPLRLMDGAMVTMRREGDAMTPFGRHTKRKLKDILTDAGVERAMKDSVPIVRNRDGILWAVGIRPGERVRAEDGEPRLLVTWEGPNICDTWEETPI